MYSRWRNRAFEPPKLSMPFRFGGRHIRTSLKKPTRGLVKKPPQFPVWVHRRREFRCIFRSVEFPKLLPFQ